MKQVIVIIYLTILSTCVLQPVHCSWDHQIFVDKQNGVDNASCLEGIVPCATFNMALTGLTKMNSSTVIRVSPGTYTLKNGNETSIGPGVQEIAIIGSGKGTVVTCDSLTGIAIISSSYVMFKSIVFNGCGQSRVLSIFDDNYYSQSALYFNACNNITLSDVIIQHSNGTGLFLYQSNGNLSMENSLIVGGTITNLRPLYGSFIILGGMVLIGDTSEEGQFIIRNSGIIDNHYNDSTNNNYCNIVTGGGITVLYSVYKLLVLDSCVVANNSRGFLLTGGLEMFDIYNTSIYNDNDAKIISPESLLLELFNVNMTDTLSIVYDSGDFYLNTTNISDGYTKWNSDVNITAHFTHIERYDYAIKSEEWNPASCFPIPFTPDDITSIGRCYNDNGSYTGHCPASYSICQNETNCTCHDNHDGPLCGQCKDGYSVAVNSPYLSCVLCDDEKAITKGWTLLIVLEFIPITIMIAVIAILNVNLNQGSLNAYIFLCQIMTIPFPSVGYPTWLVSLHNYESRFLEFFLLPFSIWNLGFINFPSCNLIQQWWWWENQMSNTCSNLFICLSSSLNPLGAISFWYIIAAYPLFLLVLLATIITLYNKKYKCVVCVVRPIHRLLTRFWNSFNIQPSLTETIASIFTLCFTQLAATSFKILHPSWYHNDAANHTSIVFLYDGSQSYFNGWHGLAGTVAIFVLAGLIALTLYLIVHPLQLFQKCIDKVVFGKDLILKVTNVFTRPYKDGGDNSWDCRYFAGAHFALQLIVMTLYYVPLELRLVIGILEGVICIVFVCVLVIFRPYKQKIHNVTEIMLFLVLLIFAFYQFYPGQSFLEYDLVAYAYMIGPILGFILVMIVSPYCFYWMIKKCRHLCRRQKYSDVSSNAPHIKLIGDNDALSITIDSCDRQEQQETDHMFADQNSTDNDGLFSQESGGNSNNYGTL